MSRTLAEINADVERLNAERQALQDACEHRHRKGCLLFGNQYTQYCTDCGSILKAYAGALHDSDDIRTGEWTENKPWPKTRKTVSQNCREFL